MGRSRIRGGCSPVNHVDLGTCPQEAIREEILECGRHLEQLLDQRVTMFSFPFGRISNIRGEAVQVIRESYTVLFSAHGGFIGSQTDSFDIPRMGVSYEASPLPATATGGLSTQPSGGMVQALAHYGSPRRFVLHKFKTEQMASS